MPTSSHTGDPRAGEGPLDSYIVRIYRREATKSRALVGVVENVGTEARRAFNDRDEPWRILTAGKKRKRRPLSRATSDATRAT